MPHTETTCRTRADGWTATRQQQFLVGLAETGSVTAAAECARSARSAGRRLALAGSRFPRGT